MSPLSTINLNGFLQRIVNWCKGQAIIDTVECVATYISIITGVNLVYHKYCIVTWHSSKICLLTATLTDKDNPSSDALLSDNSSNSQETFVEGRQVHSRMACRVSTLHTCARSPNLTMKTLMSSVTHTI